MVRRLAPPCLDNDVPRLANLLRQPYRLPVRLLL